MTKIILPLLTCCALAIAPLTARADIPPPDGYVEKCIPDVQEKPTELCVSYPGSYKDAWGCLTDKVNTPPDPTKCGYGGDMNACCNGWLAAGWTYRCKTYGASGFQVVWCRPRQPTDPPRPDAKVAAGDSKTSSPDGKAAVGDGRPAEKSDGCAISRGAVPVGAVGGLAFLLMALVGLRLGRRFRR